MVFILTRPAYNRGPVHSGFSQTHKLGKIANFVYSHIFTVSFFIYTIYMLVNVKLDISEHKIIIFQGYFIGLDYL